MNIFSQFGVAIILLGAAAGMAFYEWTRVKAGRPIFNGHQAIEFYWMAYLTLLVLGTTVAFGAIIR
jgi:uncharacterized membrane protein